MPGCAGRHFRGETASRTLSLPPPPRKAYLSLIGELQDSKLGGVKKRCGQRDRFSILPSSLTLFQWMWIRDLLVKWFPK